MSAYYIQQHYALLENLSKQIQDQMSRYGYLPVDFLNYLKIFKPTPIMIQSFESLLGLPVTGNLNQLVENYKKQYYTPFCLDYFSEQECLDQAAKYDNYTVVEAALEKNIGNINSAFIIAASYGYLDIVKLLYQNALHDMDEIIQIATNDERDDIVELLEETGSLDLAIQESYADSYAYLINNRVLDLDLAMIKAVENGQIEILNFLLENGPEPSDEVFVAAGNNNQLEILNFLLDGYENINDILSRAVENKWSRDALQIILNQENVDINTGLYHSVGDLDLFKWFLAKGATDINKALYIAVIEGAFPTLEYLLENYQFSPEILDSVLNDAIMSYVENHNPNQKILNLLIQKGAHPDPSIISQAADDIVDNSPNYLNKRQFIQFLIKNGAQIKFK